MARAILLGRLRPAGRMEIAMSVLIPRKKGSDITREALDRMLDELEPIAICHMKYGILLTSSAALTIAL